MVFRTLPKRVWGIIRLRRMMNKAIAIGKSFYDAMIFGSWTLGSVLGIMTITGFIQWNI